MKKDCNRRAPCTLVAVVLGLAAAVWPAPGPGQDSTEQPSSGSLRRDEQNSWTTYNVIVERNMFSRQRSARAERSDPGNGNVRTPPPAPDPESYYLLKGIVQENGAFIAFLEDTRGGEILRVQQGGKAARGVIKALSLDSIEYQLEDRTIIVTMGHDLQGGQGAVTMSQLSEWLQTSSPAPQQGATQPAGPSGDDANLLQQLMERRKQQLGQ